MQENLLLSTAAQNAVPSGVRRMFELAKNYDDSKSGEYIWNKYAGGYKSE